MAQKNMFEENCSSRPFHETTQLPNQETNIYPASEPITAKDTSPRKEIITELLPQIWHHLSVFQFMKLRLVCHRWKRLIDGNSALMERATIRITKGVELDRDFQPECLPSVASLCFVESKIFWVNSWWPSAGRSLVHLELRSCSITSLTLYGMLRQTPRLTSLQLNSVKILNNSKSIPNVQLDALEELRIDEDHHGDFVSKLDCPRLKRFEACVKRENFTPFLERVSDTLEEFTTNLPAEVMMDVLMQLKHLTRLKIRTSDQDFSDTITKLSIYLTKLKCLNLTFFASRGHEPQSLGCLQSFINLETLCLEGTGFRWTPICFNKVSHRSLKSIHLNNVNLAQCDLEAYFSRSDNIRSITFQGCAFDSWRQMFTAVGIHCQSLQYLSVTNCLVISCDECTLEYFDELRYIKLWNTEIPPKVLKMLFRVCPNVKELNLDDAENIDDDAFSTMRQKMKHLRWLILWNRFITHEKQRQMMNSFKNIRVVIKGNTA